MTDQELLQQFAQIQQVLQTVSQNMGEMNSRLTRQIADWKMRVAILENHTA